MIPDAVTAYTVKDDLASSIIKNMISVRGQSIALEGSIIAQSIAHGRSIMGNTASDSKAAKAMNEGQYKSCIIMSVLLLIAFGANVAYSAVSIIFPPQVLNEGLSSIYTAIIIAGYPVAMMLGTNYFTVMLNKCGKKLTL
jgi:hypothetical protein